MSMVVKNNMTAVNTLNILNRNSTALSKSLQKVSSGMKINSAADDASGYAISERMRVQIRSLDQANRNTQNGSSMMKVAEGAVSSTVEILKTLKEKAISAANDSNTDSDRQTIQKELDQSIDQIDDNANITFNGKYLVDGSKNNKGNATYNVLTNQNLATDTNAATSLTALRSRSGDSLEISSTDSITVSYVQAGKTYTTSFQVGTKTMQDIFVAAESINDGDTIFADILNKSVETSRGAVATAAEKTAMNTADKAAYGDDIAGAAGDSLELVVSRLNAHLNTTAAAAGGTLKTAEESFANNLALAIATYNSGVSGDQKISTAGLHMTITEGSTPAGTVSTTATNSEKLADLAKLAADKNAGNAGTGAIKDAVDAYKAYIADRNKSYSAHIAVVDSATVGIAASDDKVETASGEKGISITANTAGINGQISGLTISVKDSQGKVKKSANASLDAFEETIRAQNESADNAITLQIGAKANQSIKIGLTDMRSEALGLKGSDGTTLNISTQAKANAAINVLDNAIQKALDQQTTIGSVESRLEYTSSNLTTASENVQSSESTIRDADMAKEMTEYTKNNVLLQAAQSMLAQANQASSSVLSLLQ